MKYKFTCFSKLCKKKFRIVCSLPWDPIETFLWALGKSEIYFIGSKDNIFSFKLLGSHSAVRTILINTHCIQIIFKKSSKGIKYILFVFGSLQNISAPYWKVESSSIKVVFNMITEIRLSEQNCKVRLILGVRDGKLNCKSHVKKNKPNRSLRIKPPKQL